jgi:hypothetical protein
MTGLAMTNPAKLGLGLSAGVPAMREAIPGGRFASL